jgi:hypothetical protein
MFRICLCLLIIAATAPVIAREAKLSSANSGSCPEQHTAGHKKEAVQSATRAVVPERETKAKPTVHSDADTGGRLQSPRWHSFLPGMVR